MLLIFYLFVRREKRKREFPFAGPLPRCRQQPLGKGKPPMGVAWVQLLEPLLLNAQGLHEQEAGIKNQCSNSVGCRQPHCKALSSKLKVFVYVCGERDLRETHTERQREGWQIRDWKSNKGKCSEGHAQYGSQAGGTVAVLHRMFLAVQLEVWYMERHCEWRFGPVSAAQVPALGSSTADEGNAHL